MTIFANTNSFTMKRKKLRITQEDYLKANRRASRQEEIESHGHPVQGRTMILLLHLSHFYVSKNVGNMWESHFTKNASQIAERHFLEVPSARLSRYKLKLIETGPISPRCQLIRFQRLINHIKFYHYQNVPINYQNVAPM